MLIRDANIDFSGRSIQVKIVVKNRLKGNFRRIRASAFILYEYELILSVSSTG
jgi:hypothetical protein